MVRDFVSHDGGDDRVGGGVPGRVTEPRTASRLNTEVARGSSMHSKGCNEGIQDHRVYDDASGADGGRWPQVLVDCSSPDRVLIRYASLMLRLYCMIVSVLSIFSALTASTFARHLVG